MKYETLEKIFSSTKGLKFSDKMKKITVEKGSELSIFVAQGNQMTRISKVESVELAEDMLSFVAGEKKEQYFTELSQVGLVSIKKNGKSEESRPGFV